ncbi:GMC family oxidoreductase N-terminal domain-containing protein (plasmid) [Shinella yambaruensis]|uniref:GMC family oxidoreductase n=1 Tax=Shinella yambaruensis TaxID=415996 RepID=UPI003D790FA7
MSWDYIVIGAGSAGCVLANRLSADPSIKVLLLEAGGSDKRLNIWMPALAFKAMADRRTNWKFMSEPDPTRNNRQDMVPRGKGLGGSSSINAMFYVRGNRGDYDHWAQLGNRGWSYDEILPYFKKVEGNRDGVTDIYGKSGVVVVSQVRKPPKLAYVYLEAMKELGYPINPAYNAEPTDGAAIIHVTQHNGLRYSAARGYLDPIKGRPNLKIVTHATVRHLVFDGRRVSGVEFEVGGRVQIETCEGEVLLSASAINSPKLLMLSGIGPQEQLRRHGIEVLHHSPGVGRNLQEHASTQVKAYVNIKTANQEFNLLGKLKYGLQFLFDRSGYATYTYTGVGLVRTQPHLEYPDIQYHFGAFSANYTDEGIEMQKEAAINLQPNVNNSRSRGFMELRSSDPKDDPRIQLNLLSDPYDVQTLMAGGRIARAALNTRAFAPYVTGECKPGKDVQTDDEWIAYMRENASGSYHPCGTCKMGIDPDAVVSPDLKVIGIEGLRVIDSSIIPQVPSCNLNAISMAIGEKGADLVLNERKQVRAA